MSGFRGQLHRHDHPLHRGRQHDRHARLARFLDWQIEVGVPGIIILGTTGEFLTVTDDERTQLVEATVKHVNGRMQVLVGTMNAYTPNAVRYSREAEALGADGLMIVPPYYYTPTEDEIFAYYQAICEAVSIPIMLYNNPVTSNVDMSAKLVGRLTRAFENIRYIKEASQDIARVYDIIEETKGVMNVFAGERIVESFLLGAVGYVNPYGNYIPRASSRIWDYLVEGRIEDAKKIQRADQRDRPHHRGGPSDLRAPVLFQGALRRRRVSGRRRARAAHQFASLQGEERERIGEAVGADGSAERARGGARFGGGWLTFCVKRWEWWCGRFDVGRPTYLGEPFGTFGSAGSPARANSFVVRPRVGLRWALECATCYTGVGA